MAELYCTDCTGVWSIKSMAEFHRNQCQYSPCQLLHDHCDDITRLSHDQHLWSRMFGRGRCFQSEILNN